MYGFTREDIDLHAIRARLAKMSDADLLAHGRAAEFVASRSGGETWQMQLREARAEWRAKPGANPRLGDEGWLSVDTR